MAHFKKKNKFKGKVKLAQAKKYLTLRSNEPIQDK